MPAQNTEEKLLQRRVADSVKAVLATGRARFTAFLSDREQLLAKAQLASLGHTDCRFFGGAQNAERTMLCVFEEEVPVSDFPIRAVRIDAQKEGVALTHRDYLGALLALNLSRECFGDICVDESGALVYLQQAIQPLVLDELHSVGRVSVRCQPAPIRADAVAQPEGLLSQKTVASLRLDAVLAAILAVSRGEAAALVKKGSVQVNHLEVQSPDYRVCEGDVFSVRGHGKCALQGVGGESRKKRTYIEFLKY